MFSLDFIPGLVLQQITDFATRSGYIRTDVMFLFIFKIIYFNQIILVIYYDTNASSHSVSHFHSIYCDYLFYCRTRVHCLCQFLFNGNNHAKNLMLNLTPPPHIFVFSPAAFILVSKGETDASPPHQVIRRKQFPRYFRKLSSFAFTPLSLFRYSLPSSRQRLQLLVSLYSGNT